MRSCIYRGWVRHRRFEPVPHRFSYPLYMVYVDLAELPTVFDRRWLWSSRGPAPAWFRRADYLGDPDTDLDQSVRDTAESLTGLRPTGPIGVLTQLRCLGFVMNPVTFYYCFGSEGERVEAILAEITNTPWGERHTYALRGSGEGDGACGATHRFAKAFHISPFMGMDQEYAWRCSDPRERLVVHMENRVDGEKLFDASLLMRRVEMTGPAMAATLARHPWMTARVAAGIYWQALRLRLKNVPYHDHPTRPGVPT